MGKPNIFFTIKAFSTHVSALWTHLSVAIAFFVRYWRFSSKNLNNFKIPTTIWIRLWSYGELSAREETHCLARNESKVYLYVWRICKRSNCFLDCAIILYGIFTDLDTVSGSSKWYFHDINYIQICNRCSWPESLTGVCKGIEFECSSLLDGIWLTFSKQVLADQTHLQWSTICWSSQPPHAPFTRGWVRFVNKPYCTNAHHVRLD